jgi:poly(3-hydroxybutyrate) depolymerase
MTTGREIQTITAENQGTAAVADVRSLIKTRQEHSVPCLWPIAAAIELEEAGLRWFEDNLRYLAEAQLITFPPPPEWASANRIALELDTMLLRDFSPQQAGKGAVPVIVHPPYAGHGSTIADYARGQSLVETLKAGGLERVLVTDWKSANAEMKDFDIDKYLSDLDKAVEHVGGRAHLVGLCQGGWMCAMYAARFPMRVCSLVLAGAPIDTDAGNGAVKQMAHALPMSFFKGLVTIGGGLMHGHVMIAGWKSMHPEKQWEKYLDLYQHIENKNYIERVETFERWYENPINLPGAFYLQAVEQLFKENRLARGEFVALGKRLSLKDITCPVFLLAGKSDDITPAKQVFRAEQFLGTPKDRIAKMLAPGGHIGLFMGTKTLGVCWPQVARWIRAVEVPVELVIAEAAQ